MNAVVDYLFKWFYGRVTGFGFILDFALRRWKLKSS